MLLLSSVLSSRVHPHQLWFAVPGQRDQLTGGSQKEIQPHSLQRLQNHQDIEGNLSHSDVQMQSCHTEGNATEGGEPVWPRGKGVSLVNRRTLV